jgi:hypothetical protein
MPSRNLETGFLELVKQTARLACRCDGIPNVAPRVPYGRTKCYLTQRHEGKQKEEEGSLGTLLPL